MKGTVRTSNRITVLAYGTCVQVLKDGYIVWTGCVPLGPRGRHRDARRERVTVQAREAINEAIEANAINPLDVRWFSATPLDPPFVPTEEDADELQWRYDDSPQREFDRHTARDEQLDIEFD